MKPIIVQIVFFGPDSASDGDIPHELSSVVLAEDKSDALERIMPEFQSEYDMPVASIDAGESSSVVAHGADEDGRCFCAVAVDAGLKPHLFLQLLKDMQYQMGVSLEDSFKSWGMEHPVEASRLIEELDDKVGEPFVDDVAALLAMRPFVIAWREKASLDDSVPPERRHRKSRSL